MCFKLSYGPYFVKVATSKYIYLVFIYKSFKILFYIKVLLCILCCHA
uniref:Uncharacterized protein n=1 Tax=Tolypiocladia glomerulata TaxID=860646 RepID=A0A1Z1MUB6_9FLOR|nr:hypothetical protein [Tolypiocladia glomerulata]ARW69688.1 hypothetical protein [Tolypiocladia glomerulata]